MPVNQETFNLSLYDLLKTRGYDPVPVDSAGKVAAVPNDADIFKFEFTRGDKEYGEVWITVDKASNLVVYYDDSIVNSDDEVEPGKASTQSWTGLLRHLKNWSQRRQLGFELKNRDHLAADMAQREHMKKKETLGEGYYPLGKKASYSDNIPQVKIILQHTRQIEEGEQRFRNVDKIFVENINGERFLLPTKRPGLARVYARHIAEGGTPYDDKGKHITSLVEEYTKMAGFVRATKNGQFNESAQKLVEVGLNHFTSLRETLTRMTTRRGYNTYFESYSPVLNETTDDVTSLNELFVQEKLDPRIESVMPILSRLNKNVTESQLVNELDNWAEEVISEKLDSTTKTLAEPAIDELNEAPGAETLKHNQDTEKSNLKAFDLVEEKPELHFVISGDNKVVGTWDGAIFKPFDRTKYPAGQIDMIPPGCKVDKTGGPVGSKELDLAKAIGEGSYEKHYYIKIDGKDKFKTKDRKKAHEYIQDMLKDKKFAGKKVEMEIKDDYKPTVGESELEESLNQDQIRVGQLGPTTKAKKISPVLGKKPKQHPFKGKLVGASESVEPDLTRIKKLSGLD